MESPLLLKEDQEQGAALKVTLQEWKEHSPILHSISQDGEPLDWRGELFRIDGRELKEQVKIALPMILANVFQYAVNLISVMFAGHLGEVELAGAALGNSWALVTGWGCSSPSCFLPPQSPSMPALVERSGGPVLPASRTQVGYVHVHFYGPAFFSELFFLGAWDKNLRNESLVGFNRLRPQLHTLCHTYSISPYKHGRICQSLVSHGSSKETRSTLTPAAIQTLEIV